MLQCNKNSVTYCNLMYMIVAFMNAVGTPVIVTKCLLVSEKCKNLDVELN